MNIWVDGFEGYGGALDAAQGYRLGTYGGGGSVSGGRGGGRGFALGGSGFVVGPIDVMDTLVPGGPVPLVFCGYARKGPLGGNEHITFTDGDGHMLLRLSVDGANRVVLSHGGGTFATIPVAMRLGGVWRYYEHSVRVYAVAFQINIDYTLRIDEQVITTQIGVIVPGTPSPVHLTHGTITTQGSGAIMDDFYINTGSGSGPDTTFWGDTRMLILHPDGDDTIAWTPAAAGANYLQVKDATNDDDSTYVNTTAVGTKDLYTYGDTGLPAGTLVRTVAVMTSARRTVDSGPRVITPHLKHSTTEVTGTVGNGVHNLSDTYYMEQFRNPLCPSTGVAWTVAQVDAVKAGMDLTS